jgi:hypothetical protein
MNVRVFAALALALLLAGSAWAAALRIGTRSGSEHDPGEVMTLANRHNLEALLVVSVGAAGRQDR